MALVVVATVGTADANSYVTLDEAKAYCTANLYTTEWDALTDAQRNEAIVMATRLLDADKWPWTGAAVSPTQALGWPRLGMLSRNGFPVAADAIPRELKDAVSEFARQLAQEDRQADNDIIRQGITSVKAGSVSVGFQKSSGRSGSNEMPKEEASWIVIPDLVRAMLPASWKTLTYEEQILANKATPFFKSLG
jgi:hypothetical protein